MKRADAAQHDAKQPLEKPFQAKLQEAWGVWDRLVNDEYLKAVFSSREDAEHFVNKSASSGMRAQIRRNWVIVNETAQEAYVLGGNPSKPPQSVDLDFGITTRMNALRHELLAKLSDEELLALGLKR